MQKELVNGAFKQAYKKIAKLKGKEKDEAIAELNERIDMYSVAKDFSDYYPKIYTSDILARIINAKSNIEAANILTSLRKRQGEPV